MKNLQIYSLLAYLLLFLSSCNSCNTEDVVAPCPNCPFISELAPDSARIGDTVMLLGKNFEQDKDQNLVKINHKTCAVLDSELTDTTMLIVIPSNCTTGKVLLKVRNTDLLTNYDPWVQSSLGVEPVLRIVSSSASSGPGTGGGPGGTGGGPGGGGGPTPSEDTFQLTTSPIVSIPTGVRGYIVDSFFLYIRYANLKYTLSRIDLNKNSSHTSSDLFNLSQFFTPYFYSDNCHKYGNEISFIAGELDSTFEFTYNKNSGTVYNSFNYEALIESPYYTTLNFIYSRDNKVFLNHFGNNGTAYGDKTFFSTVNFHQRIPNGIPAGVKDKTEVTSIRSMANIDDDNVAFMFFMNNQYRIGKMNINNYQYSTISTNSGNYPDNLYQWVPLNTLKIGDGKLCEYKGKVLYCDKSNGYIRELDFENNRCRNIYYSNAFNGNFFYISYDEDSDFGILYYKNPATGNTHVFAIKD